MEYDLTDKRRLIIDPPLTESEFARFCAAYPGLRIARGPNGVIVLSRKREGRDGYVDWLLSQRGTVSSDIDLDDDRVRGRAVTRRGAPETENLEARAAKQAPLNRERESLGPPGQYADIATMQVHIKPRRLREALDIPFWRMIEKTGRVLDDSTQIEWLDDAEQRLRSVISRIDPAPVSYGFVVERDADGLTIHTVTGLKVAKDAIGQLSSGEWPCWNEIIEAVPEFDMTLVVYDAVSRREWLRRWDMRLQQHRIQAEYGVFA
jgi:hypothetical protein